MNAKTIKRIRRAIRNIPGLTEEVKYTQGEVHPFEELTEQVVDDDTGVVSDVTYIKRTHQGVPRTLSPTCQREHTQAWKRSIRRG